MESELLLRLELFQTRKIILGLDAQTPHLSSYGSGRTPALGQFGKFEIRLALDDEHLEQGPIKGLPRFATEYSLHFSRRKRRRSYHSLFFCLALYEKRFESDARGLQKKEAREDRT
ncbi:MAG: hypothetical protein WDN67_01715 [Candidatus Moraniibacteriota bacterium]